MTWEWDVIWQYFPRLLEGAWLTMELVLVSGLIGITIAIPLSLMRASKLPWVRVFPFIYIYFFRGTPLLVQIFLVYYGASQFDAVRYSIFWPILKQPYWCAIIAFSLNTAAYSAELFRSAIQAIPTGEIEAAEAMGMSKSVQVTRIIIPRAFGIALPAYGNEVILMLKGSALASTITLLDLTGMARTIIARTYTPLEMFLAAGMVYLAISAVIIALFRFMEYRFNRYQYYHHTDMPKNLDPLLRDPHIDQK
ncbi:ABC transporter permease [Amphritea sp. 2_MG-2023]|jgi:polar amino acid transport system permease protein|uniref:ABC transporter permease n=1 Tax=Amphritea TaxID=515417 RepID=UPI001C070A43|nr:MULTISPECIES: ABC transporter permease [Amphritea]MBU2964716.1 ABC transporter permease [Amphritea atlantica]MDO6417113.1 ABC transporter permease [Amphritea sp. 2_MG-2023]MDX2422226.1 ABC transporter permease [Amphritea sp.]